MAYTDEQLKKLYNDYSTASADKQQNVLNMLKSNSGENWGQIQTYFANQINAAKTSSSTTPTTSTNSTTSTTSTPPPTQQTTQNETTPTQQTGTGTQPGTGTTSSTPPAKPIAMTQQQYDTFTKSMLDNGYSQDFINSFAKNNNIVVGGNGTGTGTSSSAAPTEKETPPATLTEQKTEQSENQQTQQQGITYQPIANEEFGYDVADLNERNERIAQNLFNQYPTGVNYEQVYNDIRNMGTDFTDADALNTTREIMQKYNKIKKTNEIMGMDTGYIVDNLMNGKLSTDDLLSIQSLNPQRYQEIMAKYHEQQNKMLASSNSELITGALTGEKVESPTWADKVEEIIEKIGGKIEADTSAYEEYKKAINDQQIQTWNSNLLENDRRVAEIDMEIAKVGREVDKQYGALPTSQRLAIINERTSSLIKERNNLMLDSQVTTGRLNSAYNLANQNYQIDTQQMEYLRQVFQDNLSLFQDAFGIYWQTEGAVEQEKQILELEESFKNPNLESSDQQEQRRALQQSLQSYYDTYGQIIQRDINTVMQDVMNYAKTNGVTLTEALQTNFVDQLKSKPEYQELTKQALGYGTPLQRAQLQADIDKYNLQYGDGYSSYSGGRTTINGLPVFTSEDLGRPVGSTNIGADTNNFGNIIQSSVGNPIGYYKSSNGRTYNVYATAEDGYNAMIELIDTYKKGDPNMTLIDAVGKRVNGKAGSLDPTSLYAKVVRNSGYAYTPISQLSSSEIAEVIMSGEGTYNAYLNGLVDLNYLNNITSSSFTDDFEYYLSQASLGKLTTVKEREKALKLADTPEKKQKLTDAYKSSSYEGLSSANQSRYNNVEQDYDNNTIVKELQTSINTYNQIKNAINMDNTNGYADNLIITTFAKAIDSNSVVRPSEYENVAGIGSFPTKIINLAKKHINGEILAQQQRQQILDVFKEMLYGYKTQYNSIYKNYSDKIDRIGKDLYKYPNEFDKIDDIE